MRADFNANRCDRTKLTLLPFLIVAICKAVPDSPMINAHYDDEAGVVTRLGTIHMGVATQTDAGLTVPVIRAAKELNIWQLAAELSRPSNSAREGTATQSELTGSTSQLNNLVHIGGILSPTPLTPPTC